MEADGQIYFDAHVSDVDRERLIAAEKAEQKRAMERIQAEMDSDDGRRKLLDRLESYGG